MCTLTYYPINQNKFILGSSRDVTRDRVSAISPRLYEKHQALYPTDPQGGGTWWFSSKKGWSAVLLNGGFINHTANPPYRMSRGQIMLELLNAHCPHEYLNNINLINIEPFTLILFDHRNDVNLKKLVWDGEDKHLFELDPTVNHIWSSATLYDPKQALAAKQWFNLFLQNNKTTNKDSVKAFHLDQQNSELKYPIILDSPNHCSVSFTYIEIDKNSIDFEYHDLLDHSVHSSNIYWENINAAP
ncbi:hypothetical protein EMN47_09450 [Prolixibacteraceae bacterium JC049]|nr:hypothetical protein [Prolixibacteraceae bacterium JC049]